jgi:sortase (surface protein transpeptidase)
MQQPGPNTQNITAEWQRVLDYYVNIQEYWKKEIYLRNLSQTQRDYLLTLVQALNPGRLPAARPNSPDNHSPLQKTDAGQTINSQIFTSIKQPQSSNQTPLISSAQLPQVTKPTFPQAQSSYQSSGSHVSNWTQENFNTIGLSPRQDQNFAITNFKPASLHDSLSLFSEQKKEDKKPAKTNLGEKIMSWMFSDKDTMPVILLKFSFVPIITFLTVAALTNGAGVYNLVLDLPGINQVLGAKATASSSQMAKDYETWVTANTPDKFDRAATNDSDQDGLTNIEEFQLKSNPQESSTQKNNLSDGESLLEGRDPSNGKTFNLYDKTVLAKYDAVVSRQAINLRLQMMALKNQPKTSQQKTSQNLNQLPSSTVDTSKNGILTVEKINQTNLPIVWTKNVSAEDIDKEMQNGATHLPQTSLPGQTGNAVISANSSDYPWKNGDYKFVFSKLDDLVPLDKISVNATMKDGSKKTFNYLVKSKNIYKPLDSQQFQSVDESELSLSTIWPNGLDDQVLQVRAVLIG